MGPVHRDQSRGEIRTPAAMTRRGRVRPRQLQRTRADHDQAVGQAAPAAGPGPARYRLRSPGDLATSNHLCRTMRSARRPGRAQLAPNSSISVTCVLHVWRATTVRESRRSAPVSDEASMMSIPASGLHQDQFVERRSRRRMVRAYGRPPGGLRSGPGQIGGPGSRSRIPRRTA